MQLVVFITCLAVAQASIIPAPYLVRTPQHDSAVIKSDRLGGNFAYSVTEGHAYAQVSPVVQHVPHAVGVTHTYAQPAPVVSYHQPAPIVSYNTVPIGYSAPALSAVPSYALPMEHRTMPMTYTIA